jgi:predicted ester cyclase
MDQEQKRAQIEQIFDIFNRRALDELDDIFHPDYVDHTPMGEIHGVPAFKEFVQGWIDAFPDAHFELSDIIIEGDLAAWRPRLTGTNTGSLNGMPPTGKHVDVTGLHMGRLSEDGRPIEHWSNNEMMALLQQLGVIPDMAPAPAA